MKIFRARAFQIFFILVLFAGIGYFGQTEIGNFVGLLENRYWPCSQPITYSLGTFDARFGVSKNNFLAAVKKAANIWEIAVNKNLFDYTPNKGNLTINLVYDFRQASTVTLQKLGIVIHDDQATYNDLKTKYDSLETSYNQEKAGLDARIATYQKEKSNYEAEVSYWNQRGGAPKSEYARLEQEKNNLNAEAAAIMQTENNVNGLIDEINAVATVLNKLIYELNLTANRYNKVGARQGNEFKEGEYMADINGQNITIYQFDDREKLVRVLAHELGHALGLGHLNNPKAIMYRLNQGTNEKLTADDIAALKNLCGIH